MKVNPCHVDHRAPARTSHRHPREGGGAGSSRGCGAAAHLSRLKAGTVKDLLSGTAAGHPLHPVLVTVLIWALTGAVTLDFLGGTRTNRRSIGLSVLSAVRPRPPGCRTGARRRAPSDGSVWCTPWSTSPASGCSRRPGWPAGAGPAGGCCPRPGSASSGCQDGWVGTCPTPSAWASTRRLPASTDRVDRGVREKSWQDGSPHAVTVAETPLVLLRQGGGCTSGRPVHPPRRRPARGAGRRRLHPVPAARQQVQPGGRRRRAWPGDPSGAGLRGAGRGRPGAGPPAGGPRPAHQPGRLTPGPTTTTTTGGGRGGPSPVVVWCSGVTPARGPRGCDG